MRFSNLLFVLIPLIIAGKPNNFIQKAGNIEDQYQIDGGKISIGFDKEDEKYFTFYTEFDVFPYIMDSKLYAWTLAEQKMIFSSYRFSDVDVSVDVNTINENGKFDCGLYIQGDDFANRIDGCSTAYCLNLEKNAGQNTFNLKLHKFANNSYTGVKCMASGLKLPTVDLNLRAVVKNGTLYAFVNKEKTPRFSYEIGLADGLIGIRSFYSPNYFDNFTVIGEGLTYKRSELEVMIDKAKKVDLEKYTTTTRTKFSEALTKAESVVNGENQYEIDNALKTLENAYNSLQELRTKEQLSSKIEEGKKIKNDGQIYTENSFNALQIVLDIAQKVDLDDEDEVSYRCTTLERKISSLTEYIKG